MRFNPFAPPSPTRDSVVRRIAWITPDYPPDRGGVSDHSQMMVNALRADGLDVLVCSRPHERGFARLDVELAAYRPDLVVVAYTPLGYAPSTGGLAPAFTNWCIRLRTRHRCRSILLAHETSLAVGYHWKKSELKLVALGLAQIAQFGVLVASFDAVVFSNMGALQVWAKLARPFAARFHTIRICSNIPREPSLDPRAALSSAGYVVPAKTILFFGTGHEAVLFDYLEAAFRALLELEPQAALVIIGMSPDKLRQVRPSLAALGSSVHALGYVAAPQVSLWLQVALLVLAPLVEGVSARKGTVMAALQHGQAVITTRGANTLDDIPWDQICILAPSNLNAFVAKAIEASRDPELRTATGRAASAEYEAHASAAVTALRLLEYATKAE